MASDQNKDFLISLGYDPTEAKKGLEKATEDLVNFKVQASNISVELTKAQVQQTTVYTAANRAAVQERLTDLQHEIASTTGALRGKTDAERTALQQKLEGLRQEFAAQKQVLDSFDQQIQKINQLKTQYAELKNQISQARAAQTVLRPQAQEQEGFLGKSLGSINVGEVFQATGILGLGASIPFAIHKIAESMKELVIGTGEYAKQLEIVSAKTGIAVPELQQFASVGKLFGLSIDDAAVGMKKFSAAIIGGQGVGDDGITPAANKGATVLKDLGVQIVKTASGATDVAATFAATGEAIGKIQDPALRAQAAIDVFGKSGLNFLPLFVQGKAKIEEFSAAFKPYQSNLEGVTAAYQDYEIASEKSALANRALGASLAPLLEKWATFKTLVADTTLLLARKPRTFLEDIIGAAAPGGAGKLAGDIAVAPFLSDKLFATRPPAAPDLEELEREKRLRQHLTEKTGSDAAKQREIERERQAIDRTTSAGQTKLADARDSLLLPPQMLARNEIQGNQRQLDELRGAAAGLKDDGLLENLRQQNELVKKIYELKVKIVEEDKKDAATLKEARERANEAMAREAESWAKKFAEPGTYFATGIAPIKPPAPVSGGISPDTFKQQFDRVTAEKQIGAITPEKELAGLDAILTGLKQEIAARLQSKDIVGKQLEQLQQMSELVKKIAEETKATGKETGLGIFLSQLKESSELVSRFSEVFKKTNVPKYAVGIDAASNFVGMAAKSGVEAYGGSAQYGAPDFGSLLKGMQVIFKEFGKDFAEIIKPLSGALQGSPIASGAAAGASVAATGVGIAAQLFKGIAGKLGGPLGGALELGGALLGGLFGASQKNMEAEVTRIRNSINKTLDDLRSGLQGAGATLAQLEADRAKAVADLSGQKGGNKQLQSLLPGLDQQIADLKGQIKKQIDDFHKTTAELTIPEAAGRQTIDQIGQIAATLKAAALAGASAADQVKYLNAAFQDLKVSIGKDLRAEEQQTLDLLQKEIDLQTQKTNLINSAYIQQRQIQNSLALGRAFTPAQSAALQIREIGIQRDQQLQLLDNQEQILKAQIDGQAQLFGWTLKDLQSADAKTKLLEEQVNLTKQITAETISQITANQSFLASLKAGQIPALPAGLLPSNFPGWTPGSTFSPAPGTPGAPPPVQIIINAPGGNPKSITDAMAAAFRGTNLGRSLGFQ